MTQIPQKNNLSTHLLSACFNSTSATYKFYWFLSILQSVEDGEYKISKKALFARMISNAWYTINYFRLSFGKQDKLQRAIETIKDVELIDIDEKREKIFKTLVQSKNENTLNQLKYFNNQVPHWFLSPWLSKQPYEKESDHARRIYIESRQFKNQCLYALKEDRIYINPEWKLYLTENVKILKDFCFWNLALFIQTKNPNVPDIPNKLIKDRKSTRLNSSH